MGHWFGDFSYCELKYFLDMFCIDLETKDIVSKIFSMCLKINHITDIQS